MGPFDHPPARLPVGMLVPDGDLLFANPADVGHVAGVGRCLPAGRVVIALVQAQVLRLLGPGRGAVHDDGLQGGLQQLGIVAVGPVHDHPQRPPLLIHDDAALAAVFTAVGGVAADLVAAVACLAHAAVGTLPLPVHRLQLVTLPHQLRPDALHDAQLAPPLEPAVDGAVVAELLGESVPLAARAQVVDDAVEAPPPVGVVTPPSALPRPGLAQDRLDAAPQVVGDFPNGRDIVFVAHACLLSGGFYGSPCWKAS